MTTLAMITPDPEADDRRRRALRRMRTLAVSLLAFAAVVYLVTLGQGGFLGFVNAGAEASMVGAIADWFAVTALFKHPLGLPIPHTALIPRRKDELGRGLEEFVGENFLQEGIIRERVASATISLRTGRWLAEPENARRVVDEVSEVVAIGLGKVRDDHIADLVTEALVPRFREEPISPLLGGLLAEVVRDDLHQGLVDLTLRELHAWMVEHPETFAEVLGERAPWWAPERLNDAVTRRVYIELVDWLAVIRDDPAHPARQALDSMLTRLAHDLLVDPDGAVRARLVSEVSAFAVRLRDDEALRARLDTTASDVAVFAVARYGAELTAVITHTIERWDGREAARRIELHVGRDLQFIRINGTIVGGLVGVLIHTVAVLMN
jgi:uncharacterized membrane-anchored protein YjiN (DUF445 family)